VNGGQDLGGMMGFGPVVSDPDEPVFHHDWERRTFAMAMAMGMTGSWNIDASRHARETLPPPLYLTASYYEIWFRALEKLVLAAGLASPAELAAGEAREPARPVRRVPTAGQVTALFDRGWPYDRPPEASAMFRPGDLVRCANDHVGTHTRLPRYIRGRKGEVVCIRGCHVFPDANAHGAGERPGWLYSVRFDARELWGAGADPESEVLVDCWESYLEPL
jgi:nitrile hydratase